MKLNCFKIYSVLLIIFSLTSCSNDNTDGDSLKPNISLNTEELILEIGKSERLVATFDPFDIEATAHIWSSSNSSIASVDETGLVTAISKGDCNILVKALDGGNTDMCKITVVEKAIPVTSVSIDQSSVKLLEKDSIQLQASILPTNATNKAVIWSSDDTSIALVNKKGWIIGIREGKTQISVKTVDQNQTAKCSIEVTKRGVSLSSPEITQVSSSSAMVSGAIVANGVAIAEQGCCYTTANSKPTINDTRIIFSNNESSYLLNGLSKDTDYNIRLYAIVEGNPVYGETVSFKTLDELNTQFLLTNVYRDALIIKTPFVEGYNSIDICYGENPSPEVTDKCITSVTDGNNYILRLGNLKSGTKYYLRSYREDYNGNIVYSDDEVCYETIGEIGDNCHFMYKCTLPSYSQKVTNPDRETYRNFEFNVNMELNIEGNNTYMVTTYGNCKMADSTIKYIKSGKTLIGLKRGITGHFYYSGSSMELSLESATAGLSLYNIETKIWYHFKLSGYSYKVYAFDDYQTISGFFKE